MEIAKSLIDGQEWDAADFWAQKVLHDDGWFAKWTERNKAWVCIGNGCQAIAYFRSPARNNGSPAFGSRHHTPECDFRTRTIQTETDEPEDAAEVDAVYNDGSDLTIRYDRPRKMSVTGVIEDEGGGTGPTGRARQAYVLESSNPTNHQRTSGLATQLKKLRNSENYPAPNFRITVPDRGRDVLATDYFCRFEDATEQHAAPRATGEAPLMAFWGVIARPTLTGDGTLFLNPGQPSAELMTVLLPAAVASEWLGYFTDLTDPTQLTGWHLIVEGRLRKGQHRLFVRLEDIAKIDVLPPLK